jgi:hypothetical protein
MTAAWWEANVTGCHSKAVLTCRKCSVTVVKLTMTNLWQGQGVSCQCTRTNYSGATGREHGLALLATEMHARWDTSLMTEAWWEENVSNAHSKFLIRCRDCDYVSDRVSICDVRAGKRAGCFCSGGVPWSLEAGRQRILQIIAVHQPQVEASTMSAEWWSANIVDGYSKLHVSCNVCGHESVDTNITHFVRRQRFGCFCNGGVVCKKEAYRLWLLRFIHERQPQLDLEVMSAEWWQENIEGDCSKLRIFCRVCEDWSTTTTIMNALQRNGSIRCNCNLKTEATLLRFLLTLTADVKQQAGDCVNPVTGRRLRFDFGVPGGFVELDGPSGHFGFNAYTKQPDHEFPKRDLLKEEWALERGLSVVRVLSRDVWLDRPGWREHVKTALAQFGTAPARVFVPHGATEYIDSVYAELRGTKRARQS